MNKELLFEEAVEPNENGAAAVVASGAEVASNENPLVLLCCTGTAVGNFEGADAKLSTGVDTADAGVTDASVEDPNLKTGALGVLCPADELERAVRVVATPMVGPFTWNGAPDEIGVCVENMVAKPGWEVFVSNDVLNVVFADGDWLGADSGSVAGAAKVDDDVEDSPLRSTFASVLTARTGTAAGNLSIEPVSVVLVVTMLRGAPSSGLAFEVSVDRAFVTAGDELHVGIHVAPSSAAVPAESLFNVMGLLGTASTLVKGVVMTDTDFVISSG